MSMTGEVALGAGSAVAVGTSGASGDGWAAAVSAAGSLAGVLTPRIGASRPAVGASWPLSEGLPTGSLSMMTCVSTSPCGAVGTPQPHAA